MPILWSIFEEFKEFLKEENKKKRLFRSF